MFHESLGRREQRKNGGLGVDMRNNWTEGPTSYGAGFICAPKSWKALADRGGAPPHFFPNLTIDATPDSADRQFVLGPGRCHLRALPDSVPSLYPSVPPPSPHTTPVPIILASPHLRPLTFYSSDASTPSVSSTRFRSRSVESCRVRDPNKHPISAVRAEMLSFVAQHDRIKNATRRL